MNPTLKAIIIDDEPAARRLLNSMLQQHTDIVSIIGEAENGRHAVELINQLHPDLIFLDIHMPDYSGFEVLDRIGYEPMVIFTTAYEHYAVKAFESFSVDYLLKPIREERLEQSLIKLKKMGRSSRIPELDQLKNLMQELSGPKKPTAFPIRQGEKITLVRFDQVSHFEADDKYVALHTTDGKKYLTDQTLTSLSQKLPPNFLRVQKSFVINRDKIREIHKHFNGRFIITMDNKNQSRITTGLTFYETIRQELGI